MNNLTRDRQLVRNAAIRLTDERNRFRQQTAIFRVGFDRYRPVILLGGGFVIGLLLGRKQLAQATRSIASIASLSIGLMKSSLGSLLIATTLGKSTARSNSKPAPATQPTQSL